METIIVYWNCIGIVEKSGNYYSILRLYKDNGRENGNGYSILYLEPSSPQPSIWQGRLTITPSLVLGQSKLQQLEISAL